MTTYYIVGFIIILHFLLGFGYIFYKINSGESKDKTDIKGVQQKNLPLTDGKDKSSVRLDGKY